MGSVARLPGRQIPVLLEGVQGIAKQLKLQSEPHLISIQTNQAGMNLDSFIFALGSWGAGRPSKVVGSCASPRSNPP